MREAERAALVTGGGRGIGRGIAIGLAQAGWRVAIAARSEDQLSETVALAGDRVMGIPADLAEPSEAGRLARIVVEKLGPVSLLVNNAAMAGDFGLFWENDPADWWRCQELNVRAPMSLCREILPSMIARRAGRIVNMVSGAGCQAFPDMSAYVVSKTALIRLSEQLALEAKPYGVCVFPLMPGVVRTAMLDGARHRLPFVQKMLDDGLEVKPDVVARLVLTVASGKLDALSGRLLSVYYDVDAMLNRTDEIGANDLYLLRART